MAATGTRMGRPREFAEDAVLDAATTAFHRRGYHATALSDLLAATGLHKGSLYGAFGDKHTLFVTVLRRYVDKRAELVAADLDAAVTPLDGIRAYLRRLAVEAVGGRGCLSANSALELLPGDDEVAAAVTRHRQLTHRHLAGAIDRAKLCGQVPPGRSTDVLARYLYTVVEGLWELGRTSTDPDVLLDVAETALRALR